MKRLLLPLTIAAALVTTSWVAMPTPMNSPKTANRCQGWEICDNSA